MRKSPHFQHFSSPGQKRTRASPLAASWAAPWLNREIKPLQFWITDMTRVPASHREPQSSFPAWFCSPGFQLFFTGVHTGRGWKSCRSLSQLLERVKDLGGVFASISPVFLFKKSKEILLHWNSLEWRAQGCTGLHQLLFLRRFVASEHGGSSWNWWPLSSCSLKSRTWAVSYFLPGIIQWL